MAENEQKVIVEVPTERGNYSPLPTPYSQPNKLEEFKRGWINAIALPDNLPDLAFDVATSLVIPALLTSCWVTIPIPDFLRLGFLVALSLAASCLLYVRHTIPEVKDLLLLRVGLVAVGVFLGL
ncbi:hypothetical protein WDZ92_11145 [Nostoc sp. NIES-2111]